jgi:hypothetical protein
VSYTVRELCLVAVTWFLTQFSEISGGAGKGRIPWAKLKEAQDDFINPKYLPDGTQLEQFHHIRREDASAILKHWTSRQAAGKAPLRFNKLDKAAQRGKQVSAAADMGLSDQEDGESQRGDRGGLGGEESRDKDQGDAAGSPSTVSCLPKHGCIGY